MATTDSTTKEKLYKGKSGEEEIHWRFEQTAESTTKQLSWTTSSSGKVILSNQDPAKFLVAQREWEQLESERIVAIVSNDQTNNNFTIVTITDASSDAKEKDQVSLQTFEIYGPPSDLLSVHGLPHDFHLGEVTSFHVLISVASGTGQAKRFWETVLLPFFELLKSTSKIGSYTPHFTTSEQSVIELTEHTILPAANQGKQQLIVVLSGDGGVIDIINGLLSKPQSIQYRRPEIALFPLGTGNALANSSGILDDKTHGLRALLRGKPKGLPMFQAHFSSGARFLVDEAKHEKQLQDVDGRATMYGAVVCSWGLHAALVADSDTSEYRKFGAERFKMAAKENLYPADGSLPHTYKGSLSVLRQGSKEWTRIERIDHGYVLATLVSNLEAGFTINPESRPLDGILRIVHFGPVSGEEAMEIMGKAYQGGKHINDERVGYEAVSGLRIVFAEDNAHWRRVCIDCKIVRVEKNGWVEVKTGIEPVVDLIIL